MFAVGALVVFKSGFCFVVFVAMRTLKCLRQIRGYRFCCATVFCKLLVGWKDPVTFLAPGAFVSSKGPGSFIGSVALAALMLVRHHIGLGGSQFWKMKRKNNQTILL